MTPLDIILAVLLIAAIGGVVYLTLKLSAAPKTKRAQALYKRVKYIPLSIYSGPGSYKKNDAQDLGECEEFKDWVGFYSRNLKKQKKLECVKNQNSPSCYEGDPQCYKGLLKPNGEPDPVADMKGRMEFVKNAFAKAKEQEAKDPGTLNVFALPEFFFRSVRGAYLEADLISEETDVEHPIKEHLLNPMEELARQNPNWLFVFGTIIAYTHDKGELHVVNLCPILWRKERIMMCKRYVSTIDFVTSTSGAKNMMIPNPTSVALAKGHSKYDEADVGKAHHFASRMGYQVANSLFCLGGIKFAVDICLDHAEGRARREIYAPTDRVYAGDGSVEGAAGPVDVHVITSAGMSIEPKSVATTYEGVVLLCDGEGTTRDARTDGGFTAVKAARTVDLTNNASLFATYAYDKSDPTGFIENTDRDTPHVAVYEEVPLVIVS